MSAGRDGIYSQRNHCPCLGTAKANGRFWNGGSDLRLYFYGWRSSRRQAVQKPEENPLPTRVSAMWVLAGMCEQCLKTNGVYGTPP